MSDDTTIRVSKETKKRLTLRQVPGERLDTTLSRALDQDDFDEEIEADVLQQFDEF